MSTRQELIDYMNQENEEINSLILQKQQQKSDIDAAIAQQEANIDYLNAEKDACDVSIVVYNANIGKNNEIIEILEANLN